LSYINIIPDAITGQLVCKLWYYILKLPYLFLDELQKRDSDGNTLMHLAVSCFTEENAIRACAYLLCGGADIEVKNKRCKTPLGHV